MIQIKPYKGGNNLKTKTINNIRDGIALIIYFIAMIWSYQEFGINKTTAIITALFTISMFIFKNNEILRLTAKEKIKR